jgi:hypothetical protein
LKAIPELRQIISHAAVPAIQSCAGMMQQLTIAAQTQHDTDHEEGILQEAASITLDAALAQDPKAKEVLRKAAAIKERRAATSAAAAGDVPLFSPELSSAMKDSALDGSDASLLQHVAPGLRLCLAAEVAVGMLCSG